jgi:hypothetical protein
MNIYDLLHANSEMSCNNNLSGGGFCMLNEFILIFIVSCLEGLMTDCGWLGTF